MSLARPMIGDRVVDRITGRVGTIKATMQRADGCDRALLETNTGTEWIDSSRLDVQEMRRGSPPRYDIRDATK